MEKKMRAAAADLEFETAARLRDEVRRLEALRLGLDPAEESPKSSATKPRTRNRRKGSGK
jgi:excinuclease ABC subunit B